MLSNAKVTRYFVLVGVLLAACGSQRRVGREDSESGGPQIEITASDPIPAGVTSALKEAQSLDGASLSASYPLRLIDKLSYDPSTAAGLDLIQRSALALDSAQSETLKATGLVIAASQSFPSFTYGYSTIYAADLPVYISADSLLFALHRSYDGLLAHVEQDYLSKEVATWLTGMRGTLANAGLRPALARDVDLYLAVALSLLTDKPAAPVAGADAKDIANFCALAAAASGAVSIRLFEVDRDEDFSQFVPRGHYADKPELSRYFRAMEWLGRIDLRLVETQPGGSEQFSRHQFDAAVALRDLMDDTNRARWAKIDQVVGWFSGERDSMSLPELGGLLGSLGAQTLADTALLDDATIVRELARGGWGAQRIASRIMIKGTPGGATLPLDRSFTLFGQRYTVDSNVFVNTTFDRVKGRLMPNPLDIAFAALGNDAALEPLARGFDNRSYVRGLAQTRALIDAHEPGYWGGSLYTAWLSALRTLSPTAEELATQPSLVKTRTFQRRILNTQLASWSELRHDATLYAKQSYTDGAACVFPDAYVDPYPRFYQSISQFADHVGELEAVLSGAGALSNTLVGLSSWISNLKVAMAHLQQIAEDEKSGALSSQAEVDFINEAVRFKDVCGGPPFTELSGWYPKLFLDPTSGIAFDPTVADVHTQPTDADGIEVGRVLHVGNRPCAPDGGDRRHLRRPARLRRSRL